MPDGRRDPIDPEATEDAMRAGALPKAGEARESEQPRPADESAHDDIPSKSHDL